MKVGASTLYGILSGSALEVSRELGEEGISAVEILYEGRHKISRREASELRKTGIDYSLHLPFSCMTFAHPDKEIRTPQIKMVEKALKAAEKLGATHCVLHGGILPVFYTQLGKPLAKKDFYDIFGEEFEKPVSRATDSGIKVVLENLGHYSQIGVDLNDIFQIKMRVPDIGFCLDISHAYISGGVDAYLTNLDADHVHVADDLSGKDDHLTIGRGRLPIRETLEKLKNKGYNGKIIFEGMTFADTLESVKKLREMVE